MIVKHIDGVRFSTGDHITANEDPRHVARVEGRPWGHDVISVIWLDTGWRSELHVGDDMVELVESYASRARRKGWA
jgi:hypothetical protein